MSFAASFRTASLGDDGPPVVIDGKYRLDERLGEGATGTVYRALHLGLKKAFAVKILKGGPPDPPALARFRREAEALGQLRHPNIVEVTDFGIDPAGGLPYLVMESLDGSSLAEVCRQRGPLALEEALPILTAIAAAVDAAHAQGILHRDLKPANILIGPVGEEPGPRVKVLDFGLAEIARSRDTGREAGEGWGSGGDPSLSPALTETGALLGTPLYAAPELIRHQPASPASDLYSFGVLAYELLAGHPPFQGSAAEVLAGHLSQEPPPPAPGGQPLPGPVWQALRAPLSKDPSSRPADALRIAWRLRQAAESAALDRWRASEMPRRGRLAALLFAGLLLAALLLPWPAVPAVERRLQDLRLRGAPVRPPDPRILLLTLDEASLQGGPSLADRADEMGLTLERVFAAGARGVAIDFLLPAQWSASQPFSELVLRHPEALTLPVFSGRDGEVVGTECVQGFTATALGPGRTLALFGFVNLKEDRDGVTRQGRSRYRDRSGGTRPAWSARAARALGREENLLQDSDRFWIDPRIDWPRYARLSWRDVPAALDRDPGLFRGRLVLVGGEVLGSGDDYHRVPHRRGPAVVSGLTVQALLVDTLAAGRPVREPGRGPVLAFTTLLTGLALAGLLRAPGARGAALWAAAILVSALLYLAVSFPVFWWKGWVLPVSSPLVLALLGLFSALAVRRALPPAPEKLP